MLTIGDSSTASDRSSARPKRLRVGFDVAPSSSGPGRYVRAIIDGLDPDDFEPLVVAEDANDGISPGSQACRPDPRTRTLRRRMLTAVPRPLKIWAGFGRQAFQYSRRIAGKQLDIIHLQNTGCEQAPVAGQLARVPLVLGTFHVNSALDLTRVRSGPTHRALEWVSNRSLDLAIAVCEATRRDWIARTSMSPDRVVTIHNGIDPQGFSRRQSPATARAQLGLSQDALILGGVGRLDPVKGFEHLIDALALLLPKFPTAMVALAGNGPWQERLMAHAHARGMVERVALLGFQADVNPIFDACDVFVLSSLSEAMPFALLEAMAHELPCVGTTVGGVPEVIVPGETGFLAPPRDGVALAGAICPLLESVELRERFGHAGHARVVKHFHESDMVRKTLDVYRLMLDGKPAAARRWS
jgi:glycosyltransferase involved in cell wall biosynthesis